MKRLQWLLHCRFFIFLQGRSQVAQQRLSHVQQTSINLTKADQ